MLQVTRGTIPHFCNFVQSKFLHERYSSAVAVHEYDSYPPQTREAFVDDEDDDDNIINYDVLELESRSFGSRGRASSPNSMANEAPELISGTVLPNLPFISAFFHSECLVPCFVSFLVKYSITQMDDPVSHNSAQEMSLKFF